jgi:small subunit ribosomal protein S21
MKGRKVIVQDDNVEKALRKFKKKIADSGLLLELQKRQMYNKPSVQRKLEKAQAKKRWQKHLRSQQLPPKQF